jgi:hypothetical protein
MRKSLADVPCGFDDHDVVEDVFVDISRISVGIFMSLSGREIHSRAEGVECWEAVAAMLATGALTTKFRGTFR